MKEKTIIGKCHWCNGDLYEEDKEEKSNARGYGIYVICDKCKAENVVEEYDLTGGVLSERK